MELDEKIKKLREYSKLENSEAGEWWSDLALITDLLYNHKYNNEALWELVVKEVDETIKFIDENCTVVESFEERPPLKVKELIWKDE